MNRFLFFCLALSTVPLLSAQESSLVIPRSPEEMRKFMEGGDAHCPGCGVVANIRQAKAKGQSGSTLDEAAVDFSGDSGPGDDVQPVTLLSTNSRSNSAVKAPTRNWLVTVRYDDGSYAAFEQETQPSVRKGDRVQVVAGQVQPR